MNINLRKGIRNKPAHIILIIFWSNAIEVQRINRVLNQKPLRFYILFLKIKFLTNACNQATKGDNYCPRFMDVRITIESHILLEQSGCIKD